MNDNTTTAAPEKTVNSINTPNNPTDDSKYGNVNVMTVDSANNVATAMELAADLTNWGKISDNRIHNIVPKLISYPITAVYIPSNDGTGSATDIP